MPESATESGSRRGD